MSGHSKWSKIKREKGIKDKAKSNVFSKLSRIITLAVVQGGGITDPNNNIKLRLAVEKAKQLNLPKDNIQRAIEKGTGPDKSVLKEVTYEAFGPGGIVLVIVASTDNLNRTLSELRSTLEQHGGKLGNKGSVMYLFTECGRVTFNMSAIDEEKVLAFAEKIGALDMDEGAGVFNVYIPYEKLHSVKDVLDELQPDSIEIDFKPQSTITIDDQKQQDAIADLLEALDNLDDVHHVYSNYALPV